MNQSLEKVLRTFPAEYNVSGTFILKNLIISVKHQSLDLNLYGNHKKAMK